MSAPMNAAMIEALARLAQKYPGSVFDPEPWYPSEAMYRERGEPKGWPPLLVNVHPQGEGPRATALIKLDGALYVTERDWLKDNAFQQFEREAWEDSYRNG